MDLAKYEPVEFATAEEFDECRWAEKFNRNVKAWADWARAAAPMRSDEDLVAQRPAFDWAELLLNDAKHVREAMWELEWPRDDADTEALAAADALVDQLDEALRARLRRLNVSMEFTGTHWDLYLLS